MRAASPLSKPVKMQDTRWVEPVHDAEVAYSDITAHGMMSRPVFKTLLLIELPSRVQILKIRASHGDTGGDAL